MSFADRLEKAVAEARSTAEYQATMRICNEASARVAELNLKGDRKGAKLLADFGAQMLAKQLARNKSEKAA